MRKKYTIFEKSQEITFENAWSRALKAFNQIRYTNKKKKDDTSKRAKSMNEHDKGETTNELNESNSKKDTNNAKN
jgi:hypothetical protein